MRSALRVVAAAAFVAAVVIASAPRASAFENEAFGITPFPERTNGSDRSSFSIPLETGATFEDAVRIYNLTDEPLRLTLYATDAEAALDDTISVGLREEHPEGVGKWIDLSLKSIELDPRDAKTVSFRVKVRSSDPKPELGAIVVENVDRGLAGTSAQRLHLLVRTVPPNTQTSSKRVRTFLVQSPWIAIALLGLILAGALVWAGARRARRPRDLVVQPGELTDDLDAPHVSGAASRRVGVSSEARNARTSVLERVRASAASSRRRDERPLLDDRLLVEVDDDADEETFGPRDDADELVVRPPRPESAGRPSATRQRDVKPQPAPASSRTTARSRRSVQAKRTSGAKRETTTAPVKAKKPAKPTRKAAARPDAKTRTRAKTKATEPKTRATKAKTKATKAKTKAKAKPRPPVDKNFIPLKDL